MGKMFILYMKLFGVPIGNVTALTKYIATPIYLFLLLKYFVKQQYYHLIINDILSVLYGLSWATCIVGLIITNFYYKKIVARDKINRLTLILIDICLSILLKMKPLFLFCGNLCLM